VIGEYTPRYRTRLEEHRSCVDVRFGTYSVDHALNAGLDLEMPGLNKWRTLDLVNRTIVARKVTVCTIKLRAKRVLQLVKKCAAGAPEVCSSVVISETEH